MASYKTRQLYFIHPLYGRVTCYVACSKQSILHPSTLWKSYFTVTWHVQSNLYFIHPLCGIVIATFSVTWHVQSNLYFIHPLYGIVIATFSVTWHIQSSHLRSSTTVRAPLAACCKYPSSSETSPG